MIAERRFSTPRRWVWLFSLAAGYSCLVAQAAAQQRSGKATAPAPPPEQFLVVPLKHAIAFDVSQLLKETFGFALAADQRANALIISAPEKEMAKILEVIGKLDVPAHNEASAQRLYTYALRTVEPDDSLGKALRLVIHEGRGNNFALDPRRRLVLLHADEATAQAVEALLARLEKPFPGRPEADVQVRIVWLVSGPAAKDAPPPPDDLKDVVAGLAKIGLDRPVLVAQALVNVSPNASFQAKGVAKLDPHCEFTVRGRFNDKKETPALEISIRAARPWVTADRGIQEICNLDTEISAPPGHAVVLGVTPSEAMTSAFVVQVLRAEEKKLKSK